MRFTGSENETIGSENETISTFQGSENEKSPYGLSQFYYILGYPFG